MSLEVFVLGTGGMMPLPHRFLTSVLLRREGDLFLFDCGEATQISLKNLNLRWKKITSIFITHTHADHVTGLPGILMLSSQVDREEPLYIYGPPKIRDYVESSRKTLDMYINYEIIVKEMKEPGICVETDTYRIRSFPLDHTKPCYGYTLEEFERPGVFFPEKAKALGIPIGPLWSKLQNGETVYSQSGDAILPEDVLGTARRGRKFSFVTDTKFLDSIAEEVKDSDLFICEAMFTKELEEDAATKKHLTSLQAAEIARSAGGIQQMGLIHYSPRYTDWDLKRLLNEAKLVFYNSFLTKDGMSINLPNTD